MSNSLGEMIAFCVMLAFVLLIIFASTKCEQTRSASKVACFMNTKNDKCWEL